MIKENPESMENAYLAATTSCPDQFCLDTGVEFEALDARIADLNLEIDPRFQAIQQAAV